MYKIAVMGDYDSIYGFATLGLSICPVKDRDEAKAKLRQLAEGNYGIIYITEAVAAQIPSEINKYGEQTFPAIIQIPGLIKILLNLKELYLNPHHLSVQSKSVSFWPSHRSQDIHHKL